MAGACVAAVAALSPLCEHHQASGRHHCRACKGSGIDSAPALRWRRGSARFGSAAKGSWDASASDVDVLIDLGEHDARYAKRLMRAIVDLEQLPGVQVDVTTTEQATSEWFRQGLDASKELVFEAERASMAG
jgi:predicted nucleotidyltransferase